MSILQGPIERKLSRALGASVTMERLKLSLIGGTLEATGIRVGAEGFSPFLLVGRVFAEVSIAKALSKQFSIRSLTIEKPELHLSRNVNGRWNLPPRRAKPIAAAPAAPPAPADADDAGAWRMEARSVRLLDGRVSLRDEKTSPAYEVAAENILAEIRQGPDALEFQVGIGGVSRGNSSARLGPAHGQGTLPGASDFSNMLQAPLTFEMKSAEGLQLAVHAPRLGARAASVDLRGSIELAPMLAMLPPAFAHGITARGRGEILLKARIDAERGLHIDTFTLQASDLDLPLP